MLRASLCALALLLPASVRAGAADGTCDTALLLAVDISNSVVEEEYRLQIDGLADALRDPRVSEVLVEGRVALAVMQWSGPEEQHISVPWRLMEAPADVLNMSAFVRTIPRASEGLGTAPAEAIHAALDLMAQAPPCARQVVDVSGDGRRNQGRDTGKARDVAHVRGVVINGIAIETLGQGVADFYREELVTPGGFVMAARGHRDYARAIREKILRELVAPVG